MTGQDEGGREGGMKEMDEVKPGPGQLERTRVTVMRQAPAALVGLPNTDIRRVLRNQHPLPFTRLEFLRSFVQYQHCLKAFVYSTSALHVGTHL